MTDGLDDDAIRTLLSGVRTIALVGASHKPERAAHGVGNFLAAWGYRVIGVNPGLAGQALYGTTVAATLSEISEPVDMVDIFRRAEDVPPVVDEALAALAGLKAVWMQLGIVNAPAAEAARDAGLTVVMDRCPAIEIPRLFPAGWKRG